MADYTPRNELVCEKTGISVKLPTFAVDTEPIYSKPDYSGGSRGHFPIALDPELSTQSLEEGIRSHQSQRCHLRRTRFAFRVIVHSDSRGMRMLRIARSSGISIPLTTHTPHPPTARTSEMRRHDAYFLHLLRAQSWANSELSRMHGARNTCLSVYANQRIPAAPMTSNRALPWLPKKSSNPLDEAQKPYYCGTSHHHQRRLA
jgi:hypothetical protein